MSDRGVISDPSEPKGQWPVLSLTGVRETTLELCKTGASETCKALGSV